MPGAISRTSDLTRGYAAALAAAVILSTTAIFIRHLTQTYHLPPLILAFWRDVFVVATLLPALAVWRPALVRIARSDLPALALYGLVLALFNALWTFSVALNGAAIATVLVYCSGAFGAALGCWLLKERLSGVKLLVVAVTLAGCALVSGTLDGFDRRASTLGLLLGVLAGLGYALYGLMGRATAQRGLSPWTTLLYTFAFATAFLLVANLLPGAPLPGTAHDPSDLIAWDASGRGWGILFLLAAGPTVAGFGLYNVSLVHLPASVANLVVTLEPAFTAVIAYSLLGERLSALQIGGSLIIVAGVGLLRISERGEPNAPDGAARLAQNEETLREPTDSRSVVCVSDGSAA